MFQTHCERWQSLIPILWRTALCINDQSVNQLSRSSLMHSFVLCHQPIRAIYVINQSTNYHIHRWCIHLFFVPSPYAYIDPLHANLNTLFVELFKDALNEYAYAAEIAGLGYNLSCSLYGISVRPSLALLAWLARDLFKTQLGFVGLTCRGRVIVELGWQSLWKDSRGRSVWCFGENDVWKERLPGFVGQTDG